MGLYSVWFALIRVYDHATIIAMAPRYQNDIWIYACPYGTGTGTTMNKVKYPWKSGMKKEHTKTLQEWIHAFWWIKQSSMRTIILYTPKNSKWMRTWESSVEENRNPSEDKICGSRTRLTRKWVIAFLYVTRKVFNSKIMSDIFSESYT
jgi:hypothetical protein